MSSKFVGSFAWVFLLRASRVSRSIYTHSVYTKAEKDGEPLWHRIHRRPLLVSNWMSNEKLLVYPFFISTNSNSSSNSMLFSHQWLHPDQLCHASDLRPGYSGTSCLKQQSLIIVRRISTNLVQQQTERKLPSVCVNFCLFSFHRIWRHTFRQLVNKIKTFSNNKTIEKCKSCVL